MIVHGSERLFDLYGSSAALIMNTRRQSSILFSARDEEICTYRVGDWR